MQKRKQIRLPEYDYSQNGAYFVTLCAYNRLPLFGNVGQGLCPCLSPKCDLTPIGQIIQDELTQIASRYPATKIDKYVIMPNHIHAIIIIGDGRQGQSPCPTLGDIIRVLKSISTKTANKMDNLPGRKIWQYRYYDHIIRNEQGYREIWRYIDDNPARWEKDRYYCIDKKGI